MGIYLDGPVQGIAMTVFNDDTNISKKFIVIYLEKMTEIDFLEAKDWYYKLNEDEKNKILISFYMSNSPTYENKVISWVPANKARLEEFFNKK
jgi:hypothetical protein